MADEPQHRLLRYLMATPVTPGGRTLADVLRGKKTEEMLEEEEKEGQYNPILGKLAFANHLAKMAAHYKEAPFKSQAQRRKFYAMEDRGEISKKTLTKWEGETPKGKKLPERVEKTAGPIGLGGMAMTMLGRKAATRVAGGTLMTADYGLASAKGLTPSQKLKKIPASTALAELLEKSAIEVRDKSPGSKEIPVDTAGHPPYEKKNCLKESSGRMGYHGAVTESGTSSPTSALGLPMDKIAIIKARLVKAWTKGVPGTESMTRAQAPKDLQTAGEAVGVGSSGGGGQHISRGGV
jgi:hypothetical protein